MLSLSVSHLAKSFHQTLFEDFTLNIEGACCIGLIGDNGSGKSTLLKILSGEESSDAGSYLWSTDTNLGYLPQELTLSVGLSGGQKKIEELRRLFFKEKKNVILLDEPDNHLDIENKLWLEGIINNFNGIVIIISHDRKLLASVTDRIWLVSEEKVNDYDFGYAKFANFYQEELEQRYHLFKTQEKERQRLEKMVEMFQIKAAKSVKAVGSYHSSEKRLEKFTQDMAAPPPTAKNSLGISVDLEKQHKRKTAIFAKEISKSYPKVRHSGKGTKYLHPESLNSATLGDSGVSRLGGIPRMTVLKDLKFHLFCGEKVAIMGPNGQGKSTFLKILAGVLPADSGTVEFGPGLKTGYYSQERLDSGGSAMHDLSEDNSPVDELNRVIQSPPYEHAKYLERFLFTKQISFSKIKYLSGGQRSRVQLAKFLILDPEVLLLDEPTNHLDIQSVEVLEKFLIEYPGAFVLISHDRQLVANVAQKIYSIENFQLKEVI